ncbi:MAG: DUF4136 domain-containing protein [Coprobacter sp.]|nr:DUF4136 domain-containing protein [Coprobacter sp.]
MKRIVPVLLGVFLLAACEKEPDTGRLSNSFLVYTDYDRAADFGSFLTFYIPDSILLISGSKDAKYWDDVNALRIIGTCVSNLESRGYVRVDEKELADLGVQLSYVEDTYYFTNYNNPYWWWDYPGYWYPGYWGNWGGWYYPYSVTYNYSVGSLLAELIDLDGEEGSTQKLPVIWDAYMTGLLSGSNRLNASLAVEAVNQAFAQSPYLKN